jgi:hypothetical protein
MLKSPAFVPASQMLEIVKAAFPGLVRITFWPPLALPTACTGKVNEFALRLACGVPASAVPLKETVLAAAG